MRLFFVLVGAAALAAPAAAAGPLVKRTNAGQTAASGSLLTSTDLPASGGWTATTKPGTTGFQVDCAGFHPDERGIVLTGSASSPDFNAGPSFVLQLTNVYASAAQAATVWKRAVRPGLIHCVASTLDAVSAQGITVTVVSAGALPVERVGPMTAGYRVVADLRSTKSKVARRTYFDVVLVGRGNTLSEITVSNFGDAVPPKFEYALALLVYRQIGLPAA